MEWRDEGVLLSVRRHGEAAAIIDVFTAAHGRHAGVVPGGASRKAAPILQPGAQLDVIWRARLDDHIGTYKIEPLRSRTALMADGLALAGLNAICAMVRAVLAEREPHAALWRATVTLFDALGVKADWPAQYLRWEMLLLEEAGFGLDLSRCAVTGAREGLAFVSPRTGRAVSRTGAGEWAEKLLPLPEGLQGQGPVEGAALAQGFAITGHFLLRELAPVLAGRPLPAARQRLIELLTRRVTEAEA